MKRLCTPLIVCWIAVMLAGTKTGAQEAEITDRSVPAGSAAYLSIDLDRLQQFWEQVKDTPRVKALLPASKAGGSASSPTSALLGMFGQAFQGRLVISLSDEPATAKQPFALVAVLPVKDRDNAMALLKVLEMRLKQEKAEVAQREYHGTTVATVSGGKWQDLRISYVLLEDRLLVGNQDGWLEKAIDTTLGAFPAIATDPKFEEVRARLAAMGPATGWFWADPQRLNEMQMRQFERIAQQAPPAGSKQVPPLPRFDFSVLRDLMAAYKGSGGRFILSPEKLVLEGLTLVNGENEFGRKILTMTGAQPRAAKLASVRALFYMSYTNIPLLVEMMRPLFGALDANSRKALETLGQRFRALTGLDLQTDLLRYVGNEFALVLNEPSLGLSAFPVLLYVEAKDPAALGKSLQKLRANLERGKRVQIEEKNLPQGRIYMVTPRRPGPGSTLLAPGWAFVGNFLVVGVPSDALKTPLFLAAGSPNSLAAAPAYQQMVTQYGDRHLTTAYMNLGKLAALAMQMGAPRRPGTREAPNIEKAQAILGALQDLWIVYGVDQDALTYHANLSLNWAAQPAAGP